MILPGFYGKMPATGDFVTRRLPGDFVRVWDRWLAQHIASPMFERAMVRLPQWRPGDPVTLFP